MSDLANSLRECLHSEELKNRIEAGIREHRTCEVRLRIQRPDGEPLQRDCRLHVEHIAHTFGFGANSFMLDGYDTEAQNQRWESAYTRLFNLTVVPFYWSTLEPRDGELRFDADSEMIYRRPSPDRVLAWCDEHEITPKGHPLIWHQHLPDWLSTEPYERAARIRLRFEQIAERYRERIAMWDVVNEALIRGPHIPMPEDYVRWAFEQAAELFPPSSMLFYNDVGWECIDRFHHEDTPMYLLLQNLLLRGGRLDGIGIQHHLFANAEELTRKRDSILSPMRHLQALDRMADFGRPIHISEITVPQYETIDDDGALQADIVRASYRAWFSHPNVRAIIWWNLADGHAYRSEGEFRGGLLRADLSPKPAWNVLDELINHEWRTRGDFAATHGECKLRAFHGRYRISIDGQPVPEPVVIDNNQSTELTLTLPGNTLV